MRSRRRRSVLLERHLGRFPVGLILCLIRPKFMNSVTIDPTNSSLIKHCKLFWLGSSREIWTIGTYHHIERIADMMSACTGVTLKRTQRGLNFRLPSLEQRFGKNVVRSNKVGHET